ncbi:hypothetical protein N7465_002343 [Penicillium sp. CMV-2018d]|nr:hypothetical protein N7465_002343 [Penicillium sp. CMV-2018d]
MSSVAARDVFRGICQMAIEPKCSGHDFITGLARELVFDLGGHRVYGMTFSNWVMLMSLHRCARTMGDPPPTLSHGGYGEMVVERVGGEEEEKRRMGGVSALLYSHMRTFPKWTLALTRRTTCSGPISWGLSAVEMSTVTTVNDSVNTQK